MALALKTCTKSAEAGKHDGSAAGPISLPVLTPASKKGSIAKSSSGPRRAAVLIVVHVLFAIHLAQWFATGTTVSPVEPSESMKTIELGQVNAGAIFFAVAILATLVFGRFFCGWGCHIVALQDLCGWMMKKCGVRPKPFRSRVLVFVPLVLAVYMFVWPTLKRVVLAPVLEGVWPTIRADLRIAPFPEQGFTNHLMTEGFWDTFAGPLMAVPFLLICGFATVYFLGAKGFCTYGCPYGGVFGPVDLVSPGKIVVDHEKCHQCGHCTAVCTSNVRVHDEIREYGMVIDPGCMKCMDCVSVCPNEALSFGFRKPTVLKGKPRQAAPKRVYDTSLAEDLGLSAVFGLVFFAWRSAYVAVPMLMAVGIAGCVTFLAWKGWRLVRDRDVRFSLWQFKLKGAVTGSGWAFVAVLALCVSATAHTGLVNYHRWRGWTIHQDLNIPKSRVLTPGAPALDESTIERARRGVGHLERSAGFRDGGWGLVTPVASDLRAALLYLVVGEPAKAEAALARAVKGKEADGEVVADLARLKRLQGRHEEAEALLARSLADRPSLWQVREEWALMQAQMGRAAAAIDEAERALEQLPPERFTKTEHARTRLTLARLYGATGRRDEAMKQLRAAVETRPGDAVIRENYAAALLQIEGDLRGAVREMAVVVEIEPSNIDRRLQYTQLLIQAGARDEAAAQAAELAQRLPSDDPRRAGLSQMMRAMGLAEQATKLGL